MGRRIRQLLVLAGFVATMFAPAVAGAEGEITLFPVVSGKLQTIVTGPDGALWFNNESAGGIERLTTDGTVTVYGPDEQTTVDQVLNGPDGALWFVGASNNGPIVGRLTTSGEVTEYPAGPEETDVVNAASGPDGALWFVNNTTETLNRMTTTGVRTEFPLPSGEGSEVGGITTGPDGALWFTRINLSTNVGMVVRATVSGQITEYPLPSIGARPQGITTGPDGALWFVEGGLQYFAGRITIDGQLTEYPITVSPRGGITTGPDGALWFTDDDPTGQFDRFDGIGRITTSGSFINYPASVIYPTAIGGGITTGPDGALWFTTFGSYIGRLDPSDHAAPTISGAAFSTNPKSVTRGTDTLTVQVSDASGVASVEYYDPGQGTWQPMGLSGSTASATVSTPLLRYPAGRYPFQIRATDSVGNVSAPVTVYLNVYSPLGSTTGQGTVNPNGATSDPGDTLPVETGPNVRASFDFTVQSTLFSSIPAGSSTFTWGSNCNRRTSNCFAVNTSSLQWLVVNNASHTAVFQGLATLTQGSSNLGGNYVVRVTASNGSPASHYLLQVYAPGSDPDNSTPMYQASGNLASGHVTL